jgi:hypothetical protein
LKRSFHTLLWVATKEHPEVRQKLKKQTNKQQQKRISLYILPENNGCWFSVLPDKTIVQFQSQKGDHGNNRQSRQTGNTQRTQDEEKQTKYTPRYVLDTNMRKQMYTKHIYDTSFPEMCHAH